MKNIARTVSIPWLVSEDFNDIAFAKEKKGGSIASMRKCKLFRENMKECNLTNIKTKGPYFTWRGPIYHGGQRIYKRLYRAMNNEAWRLMFTEAQVKVLTRVEFSDHHPIMIILHSSKYEKYQKPFRFESAWMVKHNYLKTLKGYWKQNEGLPHNLKCIELDATEWKNWSVNHVQRMKRGIMTRLHGIKCKIKGRYNNTGLIKLEKKL